MVTATPEIRRLKLALSEERYLVVASDGLLADKVFSNEQCMQWIKPYVGGRKQDDMQSLADYLVQMAITVQESSDNVSVIAVKLSMC